MGTSPFEDRPSDEGYQPEAGSPFFPAEHDPDLSSQFVYPPPAQVPRPAPPEPTQGRALRDISKALKDDNDARARVLGSNTLDEMEGKAPDQTAALFDLGVSSAMDPTEKLLFSARGTRAQEAGDEAFEAIKRARAERDLQGAKIEHEREELDHGDPMERSIFAAGQNQAFQDLQPVGSAPSMMLSEDGGPMRQRAVPRPGGMAGSDSITGLPALTVGEARRQRQDILKRLSGEDIPGTERNAGIQARNAMGSQAAAAERIITDPKGFADSVTSDPTLDPTTRTRLIAKANEIAAKPKAERDQMLNEFRARLADQQRIASFFGPTGTPQSTLDQIIANSAGGQVGGQGDAGGRH